MGRKEDAFLAALGVGLLEGYTDATTDARRRKQKREEREYEEARKLREAQRKAASEAEDYETRSRKPLASAASTSTDFGLLGDIYEDFGDLGQNRTIADVMKASRARRGEKTKKRDELQKQLAELEGQIASLRKGQSDAGEAMTFEAIQSRQQEGGGMDWFAEKQGAEGRFSPALQEAIQKREMTDADLKSILSDLDKIEQRQSLFGRAQAEFGPDVMVPYTGGPVQREKRAPLADMLKGTVQSPTQSTPVQQITPDMLGAMAASRRQLNSLPIDHQMAGMVQQAWAIAMDRTLPLEQQAQAWMTLHQNAGVPLPEPVRIFIQGLPGQAFDEMTGMPRMP